MDASNTRGSRQKELYPLDTMRRKSILAINCSLHKLEKIIDLLEGLGAEPTRSH